MRESWIALMLVAPTLCVPVLSQSSAATEERAGFLSPGQDYSGERSDPVEYEIDFSVVVTAPYHTKVLRVWLPMPPSDAGQEVRDGRLSTFPMKVAPQIGTEPVYGNRFAYFEFHDPKGAQIIRHQFRAEVWEMRWGIDPERVVNLQTWPESFALYFQRDSLSDNQSFRAVLSDLVRPASTNPERLFAAMNWIDGHLAYDHVNASLKASAEHAFANRRGHCSDYHGLCAAMGRELGSPSRVAYGLNLFPKNSPSHCKLEAFLPPYGWVPFDLSETQKMVKRIMESQHLSPADKTRLTALARERLKRGFRDNTWLLVTRGTNYELAPKASRPVRVVRTIYAEADGEPLPDPDPANIENREFAWMTAHEFKPDRPVAYPFKEITSLETFGDREADSN
jgi:transglutaminase-like putative cysteine protease